MADQRVLDELVDLVAARTSRNVTLDDVYGRVLAYNTTHPTTDRARIDAVMLKVVPEDVRLWEQETGAAGSSRPFVLGARPEEGSLARLCVPLICRGVRIGYLWVLALDEADDLRDLLASMAGEQPQIDKLAERAAGALYGDDTMRRGRDAAVRAALLGRGGRSLEFDDDAPETASRQVVVIATSQMVDVDVAAVQLVAAQAAADALRSLSLTATVLAEADHVVVVLPSPVDARTLSARFEACALSRGQARRGEHRALAPFGVSLPFDGGAGLVDAYGQAVLALQAAAVDPMAAERSGAAHTFTDAGVFQYADSLQRPPSHTLLDRLLAGANGAAHAELLERLYDSDAPRQALADDLHLHRTSLYNRLQRIARVLDCDPLASGPRLQLHLALKLLRWDGRPRLVLHEEWLTRHQS